MASVGRQVSKLSEILSGKEDGNENEDDLSTAEKALDYEDESKLEMVDFIRERLSRRCIQYIQNSKGDLCGCGKTQAEHKQSALKALDKKIEWDKETHTTSLDDAFGDVIFQEYGHKKAKYVRVDDQSNVDDLLTLMYGYWEMEKPRLLISVTGGAKYYKPTQDDAKLKEAFCKGLVQAAESTGAWIITGGTNEGVMKLVGDSLRQRKQRSRKRLIAVGIAPWGCIESKDSLMGNNTEQEATYGSSNMEQSKGSRKAKGKRSTIDSPESPLDSNHTHFILVDDETENTYGGEIALRAKLERGISEKDKAQNCGVSVPIICIVLEGGRGTIRTAMQAIENDTPVLVIDGSGRAADILAQAYRYRAEEIEAPKIDRSTNVKPQIMDWGKIEELIQNKLNMDEMKSKEVVDDVMKFVEKFHLITVFKFDDPNAAENIHKPIIDTLLRVSKDRIAELGLALAWDRIEIARELYPDDALLRDDTAAEGKETKAQSLEDLMFTAIVNNKADFVKFFLEKGESLSDLLKYKGIEEFYNWTLNDKNHRYLKSVAVEEKAVDMKKFKKMVVTKDLARWMRDLVIGLFDPVKEKHNAGKEEANDAKPTAIETEPPRDIISVTKEEDFDDNDAAMELFYWSVINRLQGMAKVFWNNAKEKLALALIGYLMSKKLTEEEKDSEQKESLTEQTTFFEKLAIDVLSECYSSEHQMTIDHLAREIDHFHNQTVLQIAVRADNKKFLAHPACQKLLTEIWYGKLDEDNHWIKLWAAILLFPFLSLLSPLFLKFRGDRNKNSDDSSNATKSTNEKNNLVEKGSRAADKRKTSGSSYCKRLGQFFIAPVVKFGYNCLSYAILLLLYGIILLTDFFPTITKMEIFLIAWVATIVLEEGRQLLTNSSGNFYGKLAIYFAERWNILDCVAIVTFVAGVVLRFIPISLCENCFYAARIILALNFMTFFFRILHMFSFHRQLGPKLVMISKMMIDLFYFMLILMVFIAAYGVASHVILYPNQTPSLSMVRDVFSGPWWSVYGEFNIEEVSGQECEATDLQTTEARQCASMERDDLNRTLCPGKKEKCPTNDWIGPLLLAFYALITNVMMINLLIAMFSNTFAKVEDMADVVWKTQRCLLVLEYESRPICPPPIVFEHFFLVLRKIQNRLECHCPLSSGCRICCPAALPKPRSKKYFGPYYQKELLDWLDVNVEEYLMKKESEKPEGPADKTPERIDKIVEKLDYLQRNFDEISKILKEKEIVPSHTDA